MKILANGTLVTPEGARKGDVALDGGKIARLADRIEPAEGDEVVDVSGCWVFPGFIDAHTHLQCWTGMDRQLRDGHPRGCLRRHHHHR